MFFCWLLSGYLRSIWQKHKMVDNSALAHIGKTIRNDENGLSLISTLWILTILSVLATQFLYSIRLEGRRQANFVDRTKFHYAAKAGFENAIAIIRADETPFDSLGEQWANGIEAQIEDGIVIGNTLDYQVEIIDEGAKININTAEATTIVSLINSSGLLAVPISAEVDTAEESQQLLAQSIIDARPFRTVRDLARAEGMTEMLLYGQPQQSQSVNTTQLPDFGLTNPGEDESAQSLPGLVDLVTIYSIDKNTDSNGQARININSANQQQLTQLTGNNNQQVFTEDEAQALIQGRDYDSIGNLLDAQAVSNDTFDNIRDEISVDSSDDNNDEEMVNINTGDQQSLTSLDGIDQGIAESIINHRSQNGDFEDVDDIKEVKLITTDDFRNIVDKITTSDETILSGLININTAPLEVLQILPGLDETKAQAIITYRESEPENNQQSQTADQTEIQGNPFKNIADVLNVEGIDTNSFKEIAGRITYRSYGSMIKSSGIDSRGRTIALCVGAIDRTGDQIQIKYWKQE